MKKNARKVWITLLSVVGATAGLVACKGGATPLPSDTEKPVITIDGEKELTVALGETLVLPTATAIDGRDGDVSDSIKIYAEKSKFCTVENGEFVSTVGGRHEVGYYAWDKAGNEAVESVFVTVRTATEEETLDGSNDISVLGTSGQTYCENFALGPESTLFQGSYKDYYELSGTADAISGNSLIMDYANLPTAVHKIYFSNVMPYVKTGKWTVSFDVKLVSGEGFDDFYFAYAKNGEASEDSFGQNFKLGDMQAGETRRISYSKVFEIPDGYKGQYLFYMYRLSTSKLNCVLAFDNFSFTWEEVSYQTYIPTLEEVNAGFTYDWTEKYATFGELTQVADIEDESVRTALQQAEGFGDRVMHLTNGSLLNGILAENNPLFFEVGKVWTITINYYAVKQSQDGYLSVLNSESNNRTVKSNIFAETATPTTTQIRYVTGAGERAFYFYCGDADTPWDIYVGDVTVKLSERTDVDMKGKYYVPTEEELANGHTFDMTDGNVPELTSSWTDIEFYPVANNPDGLALPTEYFTGDYAMRLCGYSALNLTAFDRIVEKGKNYEMQMLVYSKTPLRVGELHLLELNANKTQVGENGVGVLSVAENVYRILAHLTASQMGEYITFFSTGNYEWYVASMSLKINEVASEKMVTAEEVETGVCIQTEENTFAHRTDVAVSRWTVGVPETDYNGACLYVNAPYASTLKLTAFAGLMQTGETYALTLKAYRKTMGDFVFILLDENGKQVGESAYFTLTELADGRTEFTVYFECAEGAYTPVLFNRSTANDEETYITEICFAKFTDNRTEESIFSGTVNGTGYYSDFNTKKFLFDGMAETGWRKDGNGNFVLFTYQVAGTAPSVSFRSFDGLFIAGNQYSLKITASSIMGGNLVLLPMDEKGEQINGLTYKVTGRNGNSVYETTFTAPTGCYSVMLYCTDGINSMLMQSVSLKGIAPLSEADIYTETGLTLTADSEHFVYTGLGSFETTTGVNGIGEEKYLHAVLDNASLILDMNFNSFDGKLKAENIYTLTINVNEVAGGSLVLLLMNANNTQVGSAEIIKSAQTGEMTYTATFTATEDTYSLKLFCTNGKNDGYIRSVNLKCLFEASEIYTEKGLTVSVEDSAFLYTGLGSFEMTTGVNGEGTEQYLHTVLDNASLTLDMNFNTFDGVLKAGQSYTLIITANEVAGGSLVLLLMNASNTQVGSAEIIKSAETGALTYTATFTATEDTYALKLFCVNGTNDAYIREVNLKAN